MLNNLALTLRTVGRHHDALAMLDESLSTFRRLGDARGVARATESTGRVLDELGEHSRAAALHREALEDRLRIGDHTGVVYSVEGLARSLAQLGSTHLAACLLGHAEMLRQRHGEPMTADDLLEVRPALRAVRRAQSDTEIAAAFRRGAGVRLSDLLS